MNDKVVLDGEMDLVVQLDGNMDLTIPLDGDLGVAFGIGVDYESGSFSVDDNRSLGEVIIPFASRHTEPPIYAALIDATGTYENATNAIYSEVVWNFYTAFDNKIRYDQNTDIVTFYHTVRRTSNNALTGSTSVSATEEQRSRFITESYWMPGLGASYFRPNRIYKWIAVWK